MVEILSEFMKNKLSATILLLGLALNAFAQKLPAARPNIVLIMVDDMGYSDIGCYGSEISTPNLDKLAAGGVKFTQFYNAARCCPSRASLLTGVYPQQAGMGGMVTKDVDHSQETPYQGWLSRETVTVAEVLKSAGYRTYMSGKWHVGEERPDWPLQRGFERYFGLISGANSYYRLLPGRLMLEDNEPYEIPENFYLTDAISDYAVRYIDDATRAAEKDPFFVYVAYTAPHWPIHAPDEEIAKYRGKYLKGWDQLRKDRYARQQKMGLLPKSAVLSERDDRIPAWKDAPNKDDWDLKMAAYAGMITRLDAGIGRIVEKLKATGQLDNTLIMFLSDNGACAETLTGRAKRDLEPEAYERSLVTPTGQKWSYDAYGMEWANLGNVPFRLYKQYTHEGGISTPLIVHYPKLVKKAFQTDQVGHIMDLMPTCLELAGAEHPGTFAGRKVKPMEGKSLVPVLKNKTREPHEYIAWEHFGCKAVRQGDWKLVSSKIDDQWELYNVANDRSELNDLAASMPEKMREMKVLYEDWAKKVGAR